MLKHSIRELCQPLLPGKAFFRPFILKGDIESVRTFLVGINPATPIFPSDELSLDKYVQLIGNYDLFLQFYSACRAQNQQTPLSRTRTGINNFIQWLSLHTNSSILETNVIPYPTDDLKTLYAEPNGIRTRAKEIFLHLLLTLQPTLLIVHSKKAFMELILLLQANAITFQQEPTILLPIEELEHTSPIASFQYTNGKICRIAVCRHLMYYGKKGDSFQLFRTKLADLLT
jgi:hypothetical protein